MLNNHSCEIIQFKDLKKKHKNYKLFIHQLSVNLQKKDMFFLQCQSNEDKIFRRLWMVLTLGAFITFLLLMVLDRNILFQLNPDLFLTIQ